MWMISGALAGSLISLLAVLVNIVLTVVNVRTVRRQQTLPHKIKVVEDRLRGVPFGDLGLTHGKLESVDSVLDLNNLQHVKRMIASAETKVKNQNVPEGHRLQTVEERLLQDLKQLRSLLEEQSGARST
jgi:hypothetical protein